MNTSQSTAIVGIASTFPFWPEGFDDLQMLSASFIYYETYASIGAFIPKYMMNEQTNMMDDACVIYTSHFFERYCERMKIPFRSRQMVLEFASIIRFQSAERRYRQRRATYRSVTNAEGRIYLWREAQRQSEHHRDADIPK